MRVTPSDATTLKILWQSCALLITCACPAILDVLRLIVIMSLYPAGTISMLDQVAKITWTLLLLGFKQAWEKVRCSWKAADRLPSLVSWLWVVVNFGFKDTSLWHSKIFSWCSLAEKYHSSSGDGNTVEGASLGEPIYIFILKTIQYALASVLPRTSRKEQDFDLPVRRYSGPLLPAKQGTARAARSRAEPQSLEQGAKELLSNAPQRQRPP